MGELTREKEVLRAHLDEWRKDRLGQFVLIHGDEVVGFFPTLEASFNEGTARYGLEDFLVEQITPGDSVNVSFFGARLLLNR